MSSLSTLQKIKVLDAAGRLNLADEDLDVALRFDAVGDLEDAREIIDIRKEIQKTVDRLIKLVEE